ncbi:MAG: aldehyde ferredoxin oxidoreductase C-terminal domain-containing protein [Candidatus Cloacimonetes bacterium]|nr:aldehyde ferredoxin oxidoreductase C-terminal domain-containing protein [Candidatus Cloacimonadota bacterium]
MNSGEKIEVIINGKTITVTKDTYLLKAINEAGFSVPTLCHHKDLTPNGSCRLCTVEIEDNGKKKMVTSCNYPIRNKIIVNTATEKVKKHRKLLAEMYLGRWPNVKVIQDIAKICGASDKEKFRSELTDENPKACILCGKCKRACAEFVQERIIDFAGRGYKRHISMPFGEVDPLCVSCTSCAYVCPTGAIQITDDINHPVNPDLIRNHGMKVNAEMATLDKNQCRMREVGTANIVEVMDAYDILPVHNYKFGRHVDTPKMDSKVLKEKYLTQGTPDQCWHGCSMACAKVADDFKLKTGPYRGQSVSVDGPEYETAAGAANMGCFDPEFLLEYNFYCDTYGIDTISFATVVAFAMECFENGIIDKNHTGGKELKFGSTAEALEILHEMACGEGFGVEIGQGVRKLQEKWSKERPDKADFIKDIGMQSKGLEYSQYMCKESLAQQAGYTLAIKGPQHDEAWLIFMDMVNNQIPSFEDKAEALYYFPLFRTWFGLMGLCKIVWNDVSPADNKKYPPQIAAKIPEHVENYWKYFEGMTGIALDEKKMLDQSARVHNLQKIMSIMLGYGQRENDIPPYRAVGPVTEEEFFSREDRYNKQLKEIIGVDPEGKTVEEKMAIIRKYRYEQYNKVTDAAFERRGWTKEGVPKIERLKELGIDLPELVNIVKDLQ